MLAIANSNDKMTCFLCGHRFRQPRILPCLHTFCTECILNLQTYPIIDQTDYSDTDSEVDWFPTRDIGCCSNVDIIQPPREFGSSEYLCGTPPRSRSKQRQVKLKVSRSRSCTEKSETPEKGEHRRPRSLNRPTSSGDRLECNSRLVLTSRNNIYKNKISPKSSPILADRNRIIMCPVCWKEVKVSTTLQELPRNLIVERLLLQDGLRLPGTVPMCDLCNDISKTPNDDDKHENICSNVTVRCLDCYENLCSLCETAHRRQKRTSTHTLVPLDHLVNANNYCIPLCRTSELANDSLPTSETNVILKEQGQAENSYILPSLLRFEDLVRTETQTSDVTGRAVTEQYVETDRIHPQSMMLKMEESIQQSPSVNISGFRNVSATIADLRDGAANIPGQGRTATCLEHKDEELKMFCVTCELNVCLDCVILRHRSHDCQFVTRELFQNQMDDVDRLIQVIIPKVTALDDQIKSLTQTKSWTVERSNEVSDEVNVFMDKFVEAVELHRKQLLAQVSSLCESKDKALCVAQEHLLQARSDVGQTCQFLHQLLTSATDVEILGLKQLLVHRLTSIRDLSFQPHFRQPGFLRFCPTIKGEVINNFQMFGRVIANQPSAVDSILHGDGLNTARLERKCIMVLSVCDRDGLPYNDNDVTIDARVYYQGKEINVPVNIVHLTDGAHQISFIPVYEGTHFLHVGVNGCSVQDSPFKFHVKARWRSHVGTWVTSNQLSSPTDTDHMLGSDISTEGVSFPGPPGGHYWTCCGKMTYNSECVAGRARSSPLRQATF